MDSNIPVAFNDEHSINSYNQFLSDISRLDTVRQTELKNDYQVVFERMMEIRHQHTQNGPMNGLSRQFSSYYQTQNFDVTWTMMRIVYIH
jgi:hypothetical protein